MTADAALHESASRAARPPTIPGLYFILGVALSLVFFYTLNTGTVTERWTQLVKPLAIMAFSPALVIAWSFAPVRSGSRSYRWLRALVWLHLLPTATIAALPFLGAKMLSIDPSLELTTASYFGAMFDIPVLLATPIGSARPKTKHASIYGIRYGAIAALVLSFLSIPIAIVRAEQNAGGRAYCIVLPDQIGYGYHAPSMLDLSAWKMRSYAVGYGGTHALTQQSHALLIIRDDDRYVVKNWSYTALNFRDDTAAQVTPLNENLVTGFFPSCQLTPHFALHIPMWQ